MKELNSDATASSCSYVVFTAADFPISHKLSPVLIDRLGRRGGGSRNRLILPLPLFERVGISLPPALPNESSADNPRNQGGDDADPS
jgi:hypothetical protein